MTDKQEEKEPDVFVSKATNIHEAIIEVMGKVGYVQKKKSKDGGLKYAYAGEAALIEALRPAMLESGITFHCSSIRDHQRKTEGAKCFTTALFTFMFTHAPSKTSIEASALGEGYDGLDKGAYKAMTGALKYALRQTFIIETGDDPDKTQEEPAPVKQPQKKDLSAPLAQYIERLKERTTIEAINEFHKVPGAVAFLRDAEQQPEIANKAKVALEARIAEIKSAVDLGDEIPFN